MARRTPHQREADLELINKLYIQGWSQRAISNELSSTRAYDLSQPTIKNDIDEIQKRWRETTTIDLDEHKAKELARIDEMEREYWSQYEASKLDKEITTKKASESVQEKTRIPKTIEASTRTETRTGNPAYLQGVERCIKLRIEILGLAAPQKNEHSGPGGGPISWEQIIKYNPEDDDGSDPFA